MECKTLLCWAFPSFIGGGLALLGVIVTLLAQNYRDKQQKKIIQGVLQAVYEELIVLWGLPAFYQALNLYIAGSDFLRYLLVFLFGSLLGVVVRRPSFAVP